MTDQAFDRVRDAVKALLAERRETAPAPRYWYPLTTVTYNEDEILEALDSLCSFRTTMGEKVARFEREFASYAGSSHAVMVNSGSSADLLLSFLVVDPIHPRLRPGDEVLVPMVTWPTHVWSPLMAGLSVRMVDVDPNTLNVSLEALEASITPRTRALFLVHLMGNPCDMGPILEFVKRHDLVLLEDCCESLGASWNGRKVGTFGLGASFSFFFSHHMTTMEGGMVTTSDSEVYDHLRILRAHGWVRNVDNPKFATIPRDTVDSRYTFATWGFNVRPLEVEGAFGLQQLAKLPRFTERRQTLATAFRAYCDSHPFLRSPRVLPGAEPIWMSLPIMVEPSAPFSRDDLTRFLEAEGVETRPVVAGNLARQPAARLFPALADGQFPGAEAIHQRGFYIGLSPHVTDADMTRLLELFQRFTRVT